MSLEPNTYGLLIVNTHGRGMWVKHMYINGEDFNKPLELIEIGTHEQKNMKISGGRMVEEKRKRRRCSILFFFFFFFFENEAVVFLMHIKYLN